MPLLHRLALIIGCVLALGGALAACGENEPGVDEPAREGLALELEGVEYNVFITRQLNPKITPDEAYVTDEAPPGESLYGVFLEVCNASSDVRTPTDKFVILDNQNNRFEPEELPEDNQFAYRSRELDREECIPEAGSVAQLGPTEGSMLLFQLPLQTTENRPLELEVEGEGGEKLTFELDI
ncbi:MAG TPA: hypothetical protein VES62_18170 [Thermoleophilaceae bacterium]|nr:hypothetical protein [Thermoleophilaceae bacterium]